MKIRLTLTLTLALLALTAPALVVAQSRSPHLSLLLVYVRAGGFISPEPVQELTVYDDGMAILARRDGIVPAGKVCTAAADATQLTDLQTQLAAAGAFFLPDDPASTLPDGPSSTLTYFVPRPNSGRARANTFSYGGAAAAPYLQADKAVQTLIADLFPDC